ncbi:molybdate ABC transporter substrate-binding protein [Georgenia subflava]|uniref:Molybdate ABC transporter substrate-binding protein n=1 Tax=Georgenia subflava TaxID=1622177 RepID=A0A6N7EC85_9MICO|nr:molybdate ABC transporter substrate-binding protein [Georgenia subflava]
MVAAVAGLATLGACTSAADRPAGTPADGNRSGTAAPGPSGDLTVFAAASLHSVFEEIATLLEQQHPELSITFSFAGSSDLVSQVVAGAPADVLATADEQTMANAVAEGVIDGEPGLFAENVLTLVTPAGNPAGITGLDVSLDGADLVVCAPQVPCGAATAELTGLLGVEISPVSEESNVTDVLGKVTSGQADAGLVYATDAAGAGDAVDVLEIPGAQDVVNRYPVATVADAAEPELAELWIEALSSEAGREILSDTGFRLP